MPIRILHVVDSLGKGGLENGLVNLIRHMDPVRFEHVIVTMRGLGPNADRLPIERVQLLSLGKKDSESRFQVPALARAIRRFRPDIVHSRNWAAIEAVVAGRWVDSGALIHSEHGLEADAAAKEPWRRICFRRLAYELADRVLAVSYQLRDLHARRTGFPAHKITVVHNGVDSRRFFPDASARARIREELGLAETDFCIGCLGNLLPVKDHVTLLHAIDGMAESGVNWRLLMIGEGPERPKLEAFVDAHPAWKNRVSFLGSSNRVPELLMAMDVYVLSSVAEGISNSLLEAMASGLPVVATSVGGNPEVVVEEESGLLFPAGDSHQLARLLLRLESQRDLRLQLAQCALRRVREEFSLESMVQKYEQLYEGMRPLGTAPVRAIARV
jgi:sugar transferase (PEP-CTERM/EpsH1 system associated)